MSSDTLNLFRRPPRPHNQTPDVVESITENVNEPTAEVDLADPRVQQMIANAFIGLYTVDEWMDSKTMPTTFKLDTPAGELYLTKSRRAAAKLVAAGKVVFTPLEWEKWLLAVNKDKLQRAERLERGEDEGEPSINQALTDRIYDMKRIFPGCKIDEILIEKDKS